MHRDQKVKKAYLERSGGSPQLRKKNGIVLMAGKCFGIFYQNISRKLCKLWLLCLLFPVLCGAQAGSEPASPFQLSKWNKSVDLIESKLTAQDWTSEKVNSTLAVLADLQRNARECIRASQSELDKINQALAQSVATNANQVQQTATADLSGREIELNDLRAECRLFLLHSQDVLAEVDKLEERLIETEIFSRGASLGANLHNTPTFNSLLAQTDTSLLRQKLGLPYVSFSHFLVLSLLVLFGVALGRYGVLLSGRQLNRFKKNAPAYTLLATFSGYAYWLAFSLLFALFFNFYGGSPYFPLLSQVSGYVLIYLVLLALIEAVFYPPAGAKALVGLPEPIPRELRLRLFALLSLTFIYYLCSAFVQGQNYPVAVLQLGMTLYLSLLSVSVVSLVWLAMQLPQIRRLHRSLRGLLHGFITALLLTLLLSEWFGFHYFAIFLIKNIVLTFILTCLALSLQILIVQQLHRLKKSHPVRHFFGVHYNRSLPELTLLQVVLLVVVWGSYLAGLLNVWVLSETYFGQLMRGLMDGFSIFNIYLVPSRILLATLLFVVLILVNRLIQAYISRRSPYYVEEGAQVATASIVGYAGFTLFLILCLIIAGVNFTGLAIIAGALSVGIGFGLQTIANNFISGLILLLDNPIRPGDRIQVGDIEGIVKRIRLRATHIYTSRHTDVFIPNSELISKSVTNFVFHDTTWSLVCPVMVEYGCDVVKVKKILLKVAEQHPEVINENNKKPTVFLKKFSENGLLFELWCLISDVSKKGQIESDLNSEIYEAFRENKVHIPYPQQDIHIKEWPQLPGQE